MARKNRSLLSILRPGIRGKLSIFIGIMLAVMIGASLTIMLKQLYTSLSEISEKEINHYLAPIELLTQEVGHHSQNLLELERLKREGANRKGKGKFFESSHLRLLENKIRENIQPASSDKKLNESNFQDLLSIALSRSKPNSEQERLKIKKLSDTLKENLGYQSRLQTALVGLNLSRYRVQVIDLWRYLDFDSQNIASGLERSSAINLIPMNRKKIFYREMDYLYQAYARYKKPQYQTGKLKYSADRASYLLLSRTLFRMPEISKRAIIVLEKIAGDNLWKKFIFEERKINRTLEETALKWRARHYELVSKNANPVRDTEIKKFIADYRRQLKIKRLLVKKFLVNILEAYNPLYHKLEKNILDSENTLLKMDRTGNTSAYRAERTRLHSLKKELAELAITPFHIIADAFANLRNAALLDQVMLQPATDSESRKEYLSSASNREKSTQKWQSLRNWIYFSKSETVLKGKIFDGMYLKRTREEALEIMWQLDTMPIEELAAGLLYDYTTGFIRFLIDQTESIQRIEKEKSILLDTVLAIAFRILFLAFLLSWTLVRAIQNIIAKAELVGKGNLNVSFEYQSKDELGKLTASLNSMVQDLREREMMRRELTAAEEIQKRLLPAVMPDNMNGFVSFGTFYKAMSGVGGDYYDFIKTGSDEFLFCIADVSNHGVGPAMIMSLLSSELKTILRKGLKDPRQICLELNQKFIHETPDHMFITLFLGTYDKTSGRLQLCSSGHNPSFIYRAGNQQVEIIKLKGFPIGVAGSEHYASVLKMKTLELGINDIFFQYTDGLNESMNKKSSQFGMKRIANFLYKNHTLQPDALVQKLARTVEVFSQRKIFCEGPSELHDDIALIAFKREK